MKAIDLLAKEHRLIARVLHALEVATDALQRGAPVPSRFFVDTAGFLLAFADGTHHRKEGVVFRAMIASGARTGEGDIALLTLEHEEGRAWSRALLDSARRMDRDPAAATAVIRIAREYIAHLRDHMRKEDGDFFPSAGKLIVAERHEQVYADCARILDVDLEGHPILAANVVDRLEREARALQPPAGG